jgi:hypothetical protein
MNHRWVSVLAAVAVIAGSPAVQASPGAPDHASREAELQKIRTGFILELGELLELDTAATIKLSDRLKPFDTQRMHLRMDNWDTMEQLKQIASGKGSGNAVELGRHLAQNRVELAQVDAAELDELVRGLPADKVAKAVVFFAQFPRRIEHMAHDILREHAGAGPGDRPPPGPNE